MQKATMCVGACSCQQALTVIRDQALARSKQQMNFAASRLDQLNSSSVCDALGGLAVDLHDLISNLWCRYSPSLHVTSRGSFLNLLNKSKRSHFWDRRFSSCDKQLMEAIKVLSARLPQFVSTIVLLFTATTQTTNLNTQTCYAYF